MPTTKEINAANYQMAKVTDAILGMKPELKRDIMKISFQVEELRLEVSRLKNEIKNINKPEPKGSGTVSIPYRGTIS